MAAATPERSAVTAPLAPVVSVTVTFMAFILATCGRCGGSNHHRPDFLCDNCRFLPVLLRAKALIEQLIDQFPCRRQGRHTKARKRSRCSYL
jgi:ribosomal protein L37E